MEIEAASKNPSLKPFTKYKDLKTCLSWLAGLVFCG